MNLLSKSRCASALGLTYWQLDWAIRRGRIPQPTHRAGKRTYYEQQELAVLKAALKGSDK